MPYLYEILISSLITLVAGSFIDWFLVSFMIYKYREETPETWRKESRKSIVFSTALMFFYGFAVSYLYVVLKERAPFIELRDLMWIALICWGAFTFTAIAGTGIYVNMHRRFVLGKLVSSLLIAISAFLIAWIIIG